MPGIQVAHWNGKRAFSLFLFTWRSYYGLECSFLDNIAEELELFWSTVEDINDLPQEVVVFV